MSYLVVHASYSRGGWTADWLGPRPIKHPRLAFFAVSNNVVVLYVKRSLLVLLYA